MTATSAEAREAVFKVLKAAWDPTTLLMIWPDVPGDPPSDDTPSPSPWARARFRHIASRKSSLQGETGMSRFTRQAVLTVEIYCPRGDGYKKLDELVALLQAEFEGKSAEKGVWFRNIRFTEVGESGFWTQSNFIVDIEYDELR